MRVPLDTVLDLAIEAGQRVDQHRRARDQCRPVAFLETLDSKAVPFVPLDIRTAGNQVIVGWDSVTGVSYGIEGRTTLTGATSILTNKTGTGQRIEVTLPNNSVTRFLRLTAP